MNQTQKEHGPYTGMGNPLNPVPEEVQTIKLNKEIICDSQFRLKETGYLDIET